MNLSFGTLISNYSLNVSKQLLVEPPPTLQILLVWWLFLFVTFQYFPVSLMNKCFRVFLRSLLSSNFWKIFFPCSRALRNFWKILEQASKPVVLVLALPPIIKIHFTLFQCLYSSNILLSFVVVVDGVFLRVEDAFMFTLSLLTILPF